ncbi:glycosyltransferase family 25 protein [Aquamicrobium terrae]|uniref:Glycosyl transferase family 25 n=1 Tax=Aquamicrobium terrae TaxID=1324945 RepID=A0ABV2MY59_9HYPH
MLPILVINLDRSKERWEKISASARQSKSLIRRVAAVDGAEIPPDAWVGFDAGLFRRNHGKVALAGEYGCYRSHLRAFAEIVENGDELAVIAEDDVVLNGDLEKRVRALFEARPSMGLLKLVNHRVKGFVRYGTSRLGDDYGRCMHGPQGSSACYVVTRQAAGQLLQKLDPMSLPYDVALDRGWATGVETFTTRHPLVAFEGESRSITTVGSRQDYGSVKIPAFKRLGALSFRTRDYLARVVYALAGR